MPYGWYSAEQAKLGGTFIYARADGSLVEVTHVTSENQTDSKFKDLVSMGEVHHWVRREVEGKEVIGKKSPYNLPKSPFDPVLQRFRDGFPTK